MLPSADITSVSVTASHKVTAFTARTGPELVHRKPQELKARPRLKAATLVSGPRRWAVGRSPPTRCGPRPGFGRAWRGRVTGRPGEKDFRPAAGSRGAVTTLCPARSRVSVKKAHSGLPWTGALMAGGWGRGQFLHFSVYVCISNPSEQY